MWLIVVLVLHPCCEYLLIENLIIFYFSSIDCGALRYLVPFEQFKKREKHPWRSVSFSKVAG